MRGDSSQQESRLFHPIRVRRGDPVNRRAPPRGPNRFDLNRLLTDANRCRPQFQLVNAKYDAADLQHVALLNRLRRPADPRAVQKCAIGAAAIAQHPTFIGDVNFGVQSTDRHVVDHNFEFGQAANSKVATRGPLPGCGIVADER